jgi:hypothetical protein
LKKFLRQIIIFLTLFSLSFTAPSLYAQYTLHVGPVSIGSGGPNPISIPPINPLEYEFVWLRPGNQEVSLSISPGVFYGKRLKFSYGTYFSMGGGLVFDLNGLGPGIYSAFGYDGCGSYFCFNIEYKKALGITLKNIISPYAVRIGVTFGK